MSIINNEKENKKLSIKDLIKKKELACHFKHYDKNKDGKIDESELEIMVEEIYKKNYLKDELLFADKQIIAKTTKYIMFIYDKNKNGTIELNEFITYYHGKDIFQSTQEDLLESSRALLYVNRVLIRFMRNVPNMITVQNYVRHLSKIGESVRPILPRKVVGFLYWITWSYCIVDINVKVYSVRDQGREKMAYCALDTSIWHIFGSIILPRIAIHNIVKYSGNLLNNVFGFADKTRIGKYGPSIIGIASIPLMISPIDYITDISMDKSIRKLYIGKLPRMNKDHKLPHFSYFLDSENNYVKYFI